MTFGGIAIASGEAHNLSSGLYSYGRSAMTKNFNDEIAKLQAAIDAVARATGCRVAGLVTDPVTGAQVELHAVKAEISLPVSGGKAG